MTLPTHHCVSRRLLITALVLCCAAPVARVRATEGDSTNKIEADRLFTEGKQRLELRDYAQACALLARSFELDPATGALLALAVCHERAGQLASAFERYNDAAARSQREQHADREQAARAKAAALAPRLSTLTLLLSGTDAKSAQLHLNGRPLDSALLGRPIPVDGGDQLIEASAAGKNTFRMRISVAGSLDAQTISIPELTAQPPSPAPLAARAPVIAPPPAPLPAPIAVARDSAPSPRRAEDRGFSGSQWVGIGTMGLGVVGLGIGTYLAVKDEPKVSADCEAPRCFEAEPTDPDDAAALAFVAGGVLAVSGLVIYLIHGSSLGSAGDSAAASGSDRRASAGIQRVSAWAVPDSAGVVVDARF